MRLPDFLIIGQMRAGTTALYSYLSQHPQVFLSDPKELRFFAAGNKRGTGLPVTLQQYSSYFERASAGMVAGEASPQYLEDPGAPQRIHETLPDVRLVAILRNPADRARSLYLLEARQGRSQQSFESWFSGPDHARIVDTVRAHAKLERFYACFDSSRICVLRFDDMVEAPAAASTRVFGFLGADCSFELDPRMVHRNAGGVPRSRLISRAAVQFKRARPFKMMAKRLLPSGAWALGKKIHAANQQPAEALPQQLRQELLETFEPDTTQLQRLTGLDLRHWLPPESPSAGGEPA